MRSSNADDSWWLTPDQRQLLLAIFAEDTLASRARNDWLRHASIATLEPASMPLVPLLFRKSSRPDTGEAVLTPFKGVYRRTWYQNHLILRDLVVALAHLRRRESRHSCLLIFPCWSQRITISAHDRSMTLHSWSIPIRPNKRSTSCARPDGSPQTTAVWRERVSTGHPSGCRLAHTRRSNSGGNPVLRRSPGPGANSSGRPPFRRRYSENTRWRSPRPISCSARG